MSHNSCRPRVYVRSVVKISSTTSARFDGSSLARSPASVPSSEVRSRKVVAVVNDELDCRCDWDCWAMERLIVRRRTGDVLPERLELTLVDELLRWARGLMMGERAAVEDDSGRCRSWERSSRSRR